MERSRKRELRDLNARAWAGEQDVFPVTGSLDSSMKKNTAFIRRLRTPITPNSTGTILHEIRSLSLHKYLSEIISACYEGLTKLKAPADIAAGVEIFSALHQRFGPEEFTCYAGWLIGRGLTPPDKAHLRTLPQDMREREEKDRLTRHKILLRLCTELWLVGALRSLDDVSPPQDAAKSKDAKALPGAQQKKDLTAPKLTATDAEPFPLEVLKELLSQDAQHTQISMIASFLKNFSWDLLGKRDAEHEPPLEDDAPLLDEAMQRRFTNIMVRYFEGAKLHLLRDQSNLNNQSRRNLEAYVRSGEVFEDRQANFEKMVKTHEKFVSSMQTMATCLEVEMPETEEKDNVGATSDSAIGLVKTGEFLRGEGEGAGIWDDEDERRFYENLVDLRDRVPGILLEDSRKKKPDNDEHVGKKTEDGTLPAKAADLRDTDDPKDLNNSDSMAISNKTVGAQVDALLGRLSQATNKDTIDEIAIDFCFVNSKASRNRLIKTVQEVPKGRSDLLPLYSRLVTTLGKCMPDIAHSLVSHLDEEFRSLQRRKQKDSLTGVRTSNIRYLAELTKFGLVPEHVIFHCFKVSLEDFSRMNIEIICNLLENCGKYLLRNPDTHPRMKSFLETLNRKKSAQHLGQQERMLIENALYSVDPPERAAIQQKERTPVELFVRKLIYSDLNKRNVERIIKQVRKLHWEDHHVVTALHKVFVKPAQIKHSSVHLLAIILGSLHRYHQDFTVIVIDDLLESIQLDLELNDFKDNQKRMAEIRYLGELYVYRMVDSSVIFDSLYKIITLGHGGWPKPGAAPAIDMPDDFFRVRLVCILIEICGVFFDKGGIRKKFDFFLTFLQYYLFTKDAMPMDIEFVVRDAYGLVRPDWKLAQTLRDAGTAFAEACKDNYQDNVTSTRAEVEEMDGDDGEIDGELEARGSREGSQDVSSSDEAEVSLDLDSITQDLSLYHFKDANVQDEDGVPSDEIAEDSEEEERIVVARPEDERDPEAEREFDRELAKMMAESVNEVRKPDRKPVLDIPLPMRRMAQRDAASTSNEGDSLEPNGNTIQFSLLSKKGNKSQTRTIDLPHDSTFAVAHRNQVEAEKAEQQRIKALVLNYDKNQSSIPAADSTFDGVNGDYRPSHLHSFELSPLQPNVNHTTNRLLRSNLNGVFAKCQSGLPEKPLMQPSVSVREQGPRKEDIDQGSKGSGPGSKRQQTRKLQMSDVTWYDSIPMFHGSREKNPIGSGVDNARLHNRHRSSTRGH